MGQARAGPREGDLLSGLARCAWCDGSLVVCGGRYRMCRSGYHHQRGQAVCKNDLYQAVAVVDDAFLATLEREALTPDLSLPKNPRLNPKYTLDRFWGAGQAPAPLPGEGVGGLGERKRPGEQ